MGNSYPKSKDIIFLLGAGALIAGSFLMPGLGYLAKEIVQVKRKNDWERSQKEWKKFNSSLLRRNLRRLRDQKMIEVVDLDGQPVVKLTQKGRIKYLKFKLEVLSSENRKWDGKWRVVMYDISKFKKNQQSAFRNMIKKYEPAPNSKKCIYNSFCLRGTDSLSEGVL